MSYAGDPYTAHLQQEVIRLRTELQTRRNEIETLKDMLTDAVEEKEMAEAELRDLRLRWSPEYGH